MHRFTLTFAAFTFTAAIILTSAGAARADATVGHTCVKEASDFFEAGLYEKKKALQAEAEALTGKGEVKDKDAERVEEIQRRLTSINIRYKRVTYKLLVEAAASSEEESGAKSNYECYCKGKRDPHLYFICKLIAFKNGAPRAAFADAVAFDDDFIRGLFYIDQITRTEAGAVRWLPRFARKKNGALGEVYIDHVIALAMSNNPNAVELMVRLYRLSDGWYKEYLGIKTFMLVRDFPEIVSTNWQVVKANVDPVGLAPYASREVLMVAKGRYDMFCRAEPDNNPCREKAAFLEAIINAIK